ncbi:MAG: TlpA family protein disulfide reductase [Burkholderiales bacterium]
MLRREFLLAAPALLVATPARAVPELDQPAPPLKGRFFSGEAFDLTAMRGQVVLVNFYSSYCKFCAYEIGNLETFQEQNRAKGFEVIVLGVDSPEDRHRVERMTGLYNLRATMVYELESNGFGRRYPTPTAFVIDRGGVLRVRMVGAKTPRRLSEEVIPLLS